MKSEESCGEMYRPDFFFVQRDHEDGVGLFWKECRCVLNEK